MSYRGESGYKNGYKTGYKLDQAREFVFMSPSFCCFPPFFSHSSEKNSELVSGNYHQVDHFTRNFRVPTLECFDLGTRVVQQGFHSNSTLISRSMLKLSGLCFYSDDDTEPLKTARSRKEHVPMWKEVHLFSMSFIYYSEASHEIPWKLIPDPMIIPLKPYAWLLDLC